MTVCVIFVALSPIVTIYTKDDAFGHLPQVEEFEGVMNLISLCVLIILGNVLDFRTYSAPNSHHTRPLTKDQKRLIKKFDLNAIPMDERLVICYCRGAALHLFAWIRECCVIYGPDGSVVEDLPSLFLVKICKALIRYKGIAEAGKYVGAPHCSLDMLISQIHNLVECDEDLLAMWASQSDLEPDSLELEDKASYRIEWDADWEEDERWKSADIGGFLSTHISKFRYLIVFFSWV